MRLLIVMVAVLVYSPVWADESVNAKSSSSPTAQAGGQESVASGATGFSSFVFYNGPNHFSDASMRREWHLVDDSTWAEVYPNGRTTKLTILGALSLNGANGILLRKQDMPDQEVFLPNKDSGSIKLMWRKVGSEWLFSGNILDAK